MTKTKCLSRTGKTLNLRDGDFSEVGSSGRMVDRYVFLLRRDLKVEDLKVLEGKAAKYFPLPQAEKLMQEFSSEVDVEIVRKVKNYCA